MMNGLPKLHAAPLLVALTLAAFLSFILCLICYLAKREKLQIQRRVKKLYNAEMPAEHRKKEKQPRKRQRLAAGSRLSDRLGGQLALAGVMLKPEEFMQVWAAAIGLPALVGWILSGNLTVILGLAIIGGALPILYIQKKKSKRLQLFTNQLGDSLTIMSNCLRSGLSLQQAMLSISQEMPEPISQEFGRVLREVRFGSTIEDALMGLTEHMKSKDLELMVSAILIQRQVGGNLSEILDNISDTIQSRIKLGNDIRVMTATGRMSGLIIGLLPVVVGLILMVMNPDYFSVFFETELGIGLLILCGMLESVGFFFISKIIKITY